MERLSRTGRSADLPRRKTTQKSPLDTPKSVDFGGYFDAVEETEDVRKAQASRQSDERPSQPLEEILDEIFAIGDKVKADPNRANVMSYKSAVKQLIQVVLEKGIQVAETTSSPNIIKQKRFTLINVIDQKLERLVSEVLQSQRETLDILGRIDEINGLLINLVR